MLVWYAAYGSNTEPARLGCYLRGGTPPGATGRQPGCRDPSPPTADQPCTLPLPLRFGGHAASWGGGGVAFAGPDPVDGTATLARAWLVTDAQLADIAAQENGLDPRRQPVDAGHVHDAVEHGRLRLDVAGYDLLVATGAIAGAPVVTITSSRPPPPAPPSPAYLRTVAAGLVAAHRDRDLVIAHLAAAPGVSGAWTPEALDDLVPDISGEDVAPAGGPE